MKTEETITKTATLHSGILPEETMEALRGLAQDYGKVKDYVYGRYSGIANVDRLTPVYSILNEMRVCGLRQQLGLPAVYYELAIAEAVGDIKGMWSLLKNRIRGLINENENLDEEDRLYLRTVLKMNSTFAAILNRQEYEMPDKVRDMEIDVRRLNNLLCRLVRRHLKAPKLQRADSFTVSPNGYRTEEEGLYLTGRIPRKRIFLPVKGIGEPGRQLRIILEEDRARIVLPVDVRVRKRKDYTNIIYAYIGYTDMLTLSNGHVYGEALGGLVTPETERLAEKNKERSRIYAAYEADKEKNRRTIPESGITTAGQRTVSESLKKKLEENNLGRKKYDAQKRRARDKTQNFINGELNRMFREEKPGKIVITRPVTKDRAKSYSKSLNRKMARSFRGYVREQIAFKCRLNGVELIEISSKGTGNICSACGSEGKRVRGDFICEACGYRSAIAVNSARNIERIAKSGEEQTVDAD